MPVAVDDGSLAKWRVSPSHPHWRWRSTSVDDAPELDKNIVSRHLLLIYDLETTITYVLLAISTLNAYKQKFLPVLYELLSFAGRQGTTRTFQRILVRALPPVGGESSRLAAILALGKP